jgi:hypothetical protein
MVSCVVVHSVLPEALTAVVGEVLDAAGIEHVGHGSGTPMDAVNTVAGDGEAIALIGPYRSADVAEVVEATAPAGLPLLAPVATWAGVTRDDEPGCDDAAQHGGTVLRLLARDTVVAARIAEDVRRAERRAVVVAGEHDYGRQLAAQLRMADLPEADDAAEADLIVLAGLVGEPEIEQAAQQASLPIIAFDGVQGADLGTARDVRLALPHAPVDGVEPAALFEGREHAGRAARLVAAAVEAGARDRPQLLEALRRLGPFDEHGDPLDPPVWLWRATQSWALEPDRPL